jgi:ABC-type nitrate/sulfonate/bicarbonate transport system substrate-binding protein
VWVVSSASGKSSPIDNAIVVFSLILLFSLIPSTASAARLRAGFASPSLNVAMLWITQEGKLFEKNGVDVEALYLESTLAQKALIAGNIDFAMMTAINMAAPKLAGADLIMLAGFVNRFTYRLMVRPEINSPADLKGKRMGIFRFGSAADRASRLVLAKLGLDPEKDVVYVQTPGADPARIAAMMSKVIDATVLNPPYYKQAAAGGMKILANMTEMDIPIQHIGLVTSQKFVLANPDLTRRIVKSFLEGIHLMRTNPDVAKKALSKYMRITDAKELEESYQLLKSLIPIKPYPTLEGFKTVFAELAEKVPAAKTANAKDFVDTKILEEFDRSGFIDGIYK